MASSGLKIVLASAFTDTTLPFLPPDSILTPGSLVLVQPDHTSNPLSGVPVSGAAIPNIAWQQAAAAIGSGTSASLAASLTSGLVAGSGLVERSAKGGLHLATGASNAQGASVRPAQPIIDYLLANPTHTYYVSLWFRATKVGVSTDAPSAIAPFTSPSGSALLYSMASANSNYPSNGRRAPGGMWYSAGQSPVADGTGLFNNINIPGFTGTPNQSGATALANAKLFGVGGSASALPFNGTGSPAHSRILYRYYLEDLTVSGRTYATVDALDYALWNVQVNTLGGRYYGDTYTAPSTLS